MNIPSIYKDVRLKFFEDEHKYIDTNGNTYVSCTTLLHKLEPHVDYDYWANKKAKERGISVEQIKAEWQVITKVSCDRGNDTHNGLENAVREISMFKKAIQYLNPKDNEMTTVADLADINHLVKPLDIEKFKSATGNRYPEIYRVFEHYVNQGYKIYSEIGVFLPDLQISGTIDILCIRDTDFVILDWKTNKDGLRFKNGYYVKDKKQHPYQITDKWVDKSDKLLAPASKLPSCNGSIYSLQLSMYATMVHRVTGLPCTGLGLCHIATPFILNEYGMPKRDEKGLYTVDKEGVEIARWFRIDYHYDICNKILEDRANMLKSEKLRVKTTLF